jgi:two-component system sensor histidine kinase/response regulator
MRPGAATSGVKMPELPPARLLIVDDEQKQMQALCNTLCEEGYMTSGFTSAAEALSALGKNSFDLLLTDLMMPGIDGIGLIDRALKIDPTLVGIVMTGQGTIDTAVQAMKAGALDYILKPFKLSAILPVLSRALAVRQLRLDKATLERHVRERTLELEAANRELEAFAHSVSHDLRAPLRHVESYMKIALAEFSSQIPAEAQGLLNQSLASARRMSQLIEDLLRLSRFGTQPLAKSRVHVAALVKEALDELRKDQGNRRMEIRVGELTDCTGDPSLLKQVFFNLLSNAVKFTRQREKALIEVDAYREPGQTVYWIRDNGVGFDMKYAEKLFGVFERLHPASEFEGTGVGLSLVQRIIQRHGGRIWAEAEVNQGAKFSFSLPD